MAYYYCDEDDHYQDIPITVLELYGRNPRPTPTFHPIRNCEQI